MANPIEQIKQFSKDLSEYANDIKSGKYIEQVGEECATAIADDIETIFESYVDMYYNSFSPDYYSRTYSLYDFYKVRNTKTQIYWDVLTDGAGSHRVNNEYIFRKMWGEGYHGGADKGKPDMAGNPHPGYMAWRTPPPSKGAHPYTFWGRRATKTMSPSNRIGIDIDRYQNDGNNISGSTLQKRVREAFEYINLRYSIFDWT